MTLCKSLLVGRRGLGSRPRETEPVLEWRQWTTRTCLALSVGVWLPRLDPGQVRFARSGLRSRCVCKNRKKRCRECEKREWSVWKSRTRVRGTHFFSFISHSGCDVCFSVCQISTYGQPVYVLCLALGIGLACVFCVCDWGVDWFRSQNFWSFYRAVIFLSEWVSVCLRVVSRWCWERWSLIGSWWRSLFPAGSSGFCWPQPDSALASPAAPPDSSTARLAPFLSSVPFKMIKKKLVGVVNRF